MTLWCSPCLATHEAEAAVTIEDGAALCARHLARVIENPAMSETELQEMIERTLETEAARNRRAGKVW